MDDTNMTSPMANNKTESTRPTLGSFRQPSLQDCLEAYGTRSNRSRRHLLARAASVKNTSTAPMSSCTSSSVPAVVVDDAPTLSLSVSLHSDKSAPATATRPGLASHRVPSLRDCMEAYKSPPRSSLRRQQNENSNDSVDGRRGILRQASCSGSIGGNQITNKIDLDLFPNGSSSLSKHRAASSRDIMRVPNSEVENDTLPRNSCTSISFNSTDHDYSMHDDDGKHNGGIIYGPLGSSFSSFQRHHMAHRNDNQRFRNRMNASFGSLTETCNDDDCSTVVEEERNNTHKYPTTVLDEDYTSSSDLSTFDVHRMMQVTIPNDAHVRVPIDNINIRV